MALVCVLQCARACMQTETLSGTHSQCFSNHLGEAKCEIDHVLLMSVPPLGQSACFFVEDHMKWRRKNSSQRVWVRMSEKLVILYACVLICQRKYHSLLVDGVV